MTKSFPELLAFVLAIGLVSFAAPAWAEDDAGQEASPPAAAAGADTKDESFLEKLEEDFKETTTPTDEETDAIGTSEDAGRDLY